MPFPPSPQNKDNQEKKNYRKKFGPSDREALPALRKQTPLTADSFHIIAQHLAPNTLEQALALLDQENILNESNRAFISTKNNPLQFAEILLILQEHNLLKEENLIALQDCTDPTQVFIAMTLLQNHSLLKKENLTVLNHCTQPKQVAIALIFLKKKRLLTKENRNLLKECAQPIEVAEALIALNKEKLLTKKNRALFQQDRYPTEAAYAIIKMDEYGFLTKENLALLQQDTNPTQVANALILVKMHPLLEKKIRALLQQTTDRTQVANALLLLNKHDLLQEENLALLQQATNPTQVANAFFLLNTHHLLQKENIDLFKRYRLVSYTEAAVMIKDLAENQLLTSKNLVQVKSHRSYFSVINAVKELAKNKILNQENFDLIITNENSLEIAQILSLLTKKEIAKDQIHFFTQEDDEKKTHFQTLRLLYKAGILDEKTLTIIKIYASEFKKDAFYSCFDLAKLLILLKDHSILTEENVAKIKNIDPDDLQLTTAIIKNLIKAKILDDSHLNAVIKCKNLNLMDMKIRGLLKKKKLNTTTFAELINEIEIESTYFETSASSLEKTKTSTSLQNPTESMVVSQEDNSQNTLSDQSKLNASGSQEKPDEEKLLKTDQSSISASQDSLNSEVLQSNDSNLPVPENQNKTDTVKNDSDLPPQNTEQSTDNKELKENSTHKNLDEETPLKTNLVVPIEHKEGMMTYPFANLISTLFESSTLLASRALECSTACCAYIVSLIQETKQSAQSRGKMLSFSSLMNFMGMFRANQAEGSQSNVTQSDAENQKNMPQSQIPSV